MSKITTLVCFTCLIGCANLPTDTESVGTVYDELVAGGGGKAGTGGTAGYHSGGTAGTAGTSNTGGYHSGGTAGTGNIAGNPPCWDAVTTPMPFGDNTEANQAANDGAEAGWADGYAIGCANDEESASKSTSALSQSSYFCWPGGRHRFCVYAAAWATARACVSLSCEGRTVSACAYASAYAFAWSCSGPRWYYWW